MRMACEQLFERTSDRGDFELLLSFAKADRERLWIGRYWHYLGQTANTWFVMCPFCMTIWELGPTRKELEKVKDWKRCPKCRKKLNTERMLILEREKTAGFKPKPNQTGKAEKA